MRKKTAVADFGSKFPKAVTKAREVDYTPKADRLSPRYGQPEIVPLDTFELWWMRNGMFYNGIPKQTARWIYNAENGPP